MPKSKIPIGEQIEKAKVDIKQRENQLKTLIQKKKNLERNARTRRLIERGAILESLIEGALDLTNEQVKALLQFALATVSVREMVVAFISENNATATEQDSASQSTETF